MSDSRMMAAADTLKALRDEKVELQAKMKEVQADIDAVEAELISLMTDEECSLQAKSTLQSLRHWPRMNCKMTPQDNGGPIRIDSRMAGSASVNVCMDTR